MPDRPQLDAIHIERLILHSGLHRLRADTLAHDRERSLGQAATALSALCAVDDRDGPDEIWETLAALDRPLLLAFATYAISELARTDYPAGGALPAPADNN